MPNPNWTLSKRGRVETAYGTWLFRCSPAGFTASQGGGKLAIKLGVVPVGGTYLIADILTALMAKLDTEAG